MKNGYHENYLKIDLTEKLISQSPLTPEVLKRWIGGVGLGSKILMDETLAGFDPLGAESAIVFALSPLVGTPLTTSAKFAIVAKSPLTNRICDAMCSSGFALTAKKLGTDAICIKGRNVQWSVLMIETDRTGNKKFQLIPADEYLGLSARQTEVMIKNRYGEKWQVISIGKAGEMQIPYATLSHDGRHAGRGGLGAVLGSKRIKAIAVYGDQHFEIHDTNETMKIARSLSEKSFGPETSKYRELGTVANLLVFNRFNALPTRNFQSGHFDEAQLLAQQDLSPARKLARNSCRSCTIGCEHVYAIGPSDKNGVRMEYESLFALGPLCSVSDPEDVLKCASLCDEYGLDTISTGGTIAFLMDCVERGIISGKFDNNQSELKFGDGKAILRLIELITTPDDSCLVQLLRLGSRKAAFAIGQDSIKFAAQVKGMELPGYHPSKLHAMALGLAVGTRGADHNRSGAYEFDFKHHSNQAEAIAEGVIETENKSAIMDSAILCKFIRGVFSDYYSDIAGLLNAVTGFGFNAIELEEAGARIVGIRKAFNQREGWSMLEDTLPESLMSRNSKESESLEFEKSGDNVMSVEKLNSMIQLYYKKRGWTEQGFVNDMNDISR